MKQFLEYSNVQTVLDVGGNSGQFGELLRLLGYRADIVSFEPLSDAYKELSVRVTNDSRWSAHMIALGDRDGKEVIHVSENSQSSSLLPMLSSHLDSAPKSRVIREEVVEVRRLDSFAKSELPSMNEAILLKIDAQGYEAKVLEGSKGILDSISAVQLELSLVPLYEGEVLFEDMLPRMKGSGFQLVSVESGFTCKESGKMLQIDALFSRR